MKEKLLFCFFCLCITSAFAKKLSSDCGIIVDALIAKQTIFTAKIIEILPDTYDTINFEGTRKRQTVLRDKRNLYIGASYVPSYKVRVIKCLNGSIDTNAIYTVNGYGYDLGDTLLLGNLYYLEESQHLLDVRMGILGCMRLGYKVGYELEEQSKLNSRSDGYQTPFYIYQVCLVFEQLKHTEGCFTLRYPNGNLMVTGIMHNGNRVGNWTFYYEDGMIYQIVTYGTHDFIAMTKVFSYIYTDGNRTDFGFHSHTPAMFRKDFFYKTEGFFIMYKGANRVNIAQYMNAEGVVQYKSISIEEQNTPDKITHYSLINYFSDSLHIKNKTSLIIQHTDTKKFESPRFTYSLKYNKENQKESERLNWFGTEKNNDEHKYEYRIYEKNRLKMKIVGCEDLGGTNKNIKKYYNANGKLIKETQEPSEEDSE